MALSKEHQSFLSRFAKPDLHYSFEDAPIAYLRNAKITSQHIYI